MTTRRSSHLFRTSQDMSIERGCPTVQRYLLLPKRVQFARPVKVETVLYRALEVSSAVVSMWPTPRVSLAKAPVELAPCRVEDQHKCHG